MVHLGYVGNLRKFIANQVFKSFIMKKINTCTINQFRDVKVCQEFVNQGWTRGIINLTHKKVILGILCPPLLTINSLYTFEKIGDDGGDLTVWQKIFVFFRKE